MAIVTQCTAPGCETLTMGPLCIEHDVPVTREFVRGRPFTRTQTPFALRFTTTATVSAPRLRRASERAVAVRSHH